MTVTFEQLQKANEAINTMTISRQNRRTGEVTSKEYAEVNQRVKAFRMVYPQGKIFTEMVSNENGICIFRATVYDENGEVLSTGTAFEKQTSSQINQTSYIENCETSACGRALGFAGFGIDTSIASYEEVKNAQAQQDKQEGENKASEQANAKDKANAKAVVIMATEAQKSMLSTLLSGAVPAELQAWLGETYGVNSVDDIGNLTAGHASEIIEWAQSTVKRWWSNANDKARKNMLDRFSINDITELQPVSRMEAAKAILGIK